MMILLIESLNVNVGKFTYDSIIRGGWEKRNFIKCSTDLKYCEGVQHFFFDREFQCFNSIPRGRFHTPAKESKKDIFGRFSIYGGVRGRKNS